MRPGLCSPNSSAPLLVLASCLIPLRFASQFMREAAGCWAWLAEAVSSRIEDHLLFLFQQQQLQHLSHHASPIPLTPHPSSMQPSSLSGVSSTSGLLALSGALMAQSQLAAKEDGAAHDGESRGKSKTQGWLSQCQAGIPEVHGQRWERFCCCSACSQGSSVPGSCSLGPGGAARTANDRSS